MADPIGQVYVRVSPDTRGFAAATRRELRALKSLDKQEFKVQIGLDTRKLYEDFDRAVADLKLRALDEKNRISFKTDLDWNERLGRKQIKEQVESYASVAADHPIGIATEIEGQDSDGDIDLTGDLNLRIDRDNIIAEVEKILARAAAKAELDIDIDKDDVKEEADTAVGILREVWSKAFRRDALRMEIDANLTDVTEAELKLSDLRDDFKSINENLASNGYALRQVSKEYDSVRDRLGVISERMGRINDESRKGAKRFAKMGEELSKNLDKLKAISLDRARLLEMDRKIRVEANISQNSLAEAEAEMREFVRTLEENEAELGVNLSEVDFRAVATRLAALARTRIALIITAMPPQTRRSIESLERIGNTQWKKIGGIIGGFAGRTTGIRLLYQTARDMLDIVPKLDMMIPQLAAAAGLAATGVAGIGALLASTVSIVADAARVFQGILLAPAGLAGLGVAGLTYYAAWSKMRDLAPEIVDGWNDVIDTLGSDFWKADAGRVSGFFVDLFNALEFYSPRITKSIADVTAALTEGFAETASVNGPRLMENIIAGLDAARGGFRSLGSALTTLAAAGSEVFGDMGTWFTDIMGDFDNWVKRNDNNGNIERWIRQAGQALEDLSSVVYEAGSMFMEFGRIVKEAGGPSLSDFAAGMRELRDAMEGDFFRTISLTTMTAMFNFLDEFQRIKPEAMSAVATAAGLLVYSLNGLKGPVVDAFGAIFRGFSSPTFIDGWTTFIDGIGAFIEDITPGLERFTSELGGLFGIVGTGADAFGEAFNELLILVSNIGANIHPGLEDFLKFVGPELEELIKAVGPGLEDMADSISDLLSNEGFQDFLSDVNDKFQIIVPIIEDAADAMIDLTDAIFSEYESLPPWMQEFISWGVALGATGFGVGGLLLGITSRFKGFRRKLAIALARIFTPGGMTRILTPILGRFFAGFLGPLGWIVVVGSLVRPVDAARLADGIVDALGLGDSWLGQFTNRLRERFEEAFGGQSLLDMFIENIQEAWGHFTQGDLVQGLIDVFAGNPLDIFGAIMDAVFDVFGLSDDLANWQERWPEYFGEADSGFTGLFEAMLSNIEDAIQSGWEWLVNQITSFNPIKDTWNIIKFLGGKILDWLGIGGGETENSAASSLSGSVPGGSGISADLDSNLDFQTSFIDPILQHLGDEWDELVAKIKGWSPLGGIFDIMGWLVGKIPEWLGLLGDGLLGGTVGGGSGPAGGMGSLGETLGNWGSKIWSGTVKPWLDEGWTTLNERINGWGPGGGEGEGGTLNLGGVISRVLGLLNPDVAYIDGQLASISSTLSGFGSSTRAEYGATSESVKLSTGSMRDRVGVNFQTMIDKALGLTSKLKADGSSDFTGLRSLSLSEMSTLRSGALSETDKTRRGASSDFSGLRSKGIAEMVSLAVNAISQAGRMRDGVSSASSSAERSSVSSARRMNNGFVSQMVSMASRAIGQARRISGTLPGILTFSASGAGRYVANTFVSALGGGLRRAYSVARSIASGVRSALRFSARGSGQAVGSSFAGGLRSMVGSVGSAAGRLAAAARRNLPNSPAEEGPFSGSGWGGWGESIGEELAKGLRSTIPLVAREAENLTAAVSSNLENLESPTSGGIRFQRSRLAQMQGASGAAGSAGRDINVYVESTSDDPLQDGRRLGGDLNFALAAEGV